MLNIVQAVLVQVVLRRSSNSDWPTPRLCISDTGLRVILKVHALLTPISQC